MGPGRLWYAGGSACGDTFASERAPLLPCAWALLPVQPLPRAHALFNQRALADGSVRWNYHSCGTYECLNRRTVGDCKNCFNMTLEANRWRVRYRGSLTIREVVDMKGGALR